MQSARRFPEFGVILAATFRMSYYCIKVSQVLCKVVSGSARITGIDTFERSWPMDFLRMSHIGTFSLGSRKNGRVNLLSLVTKISEFLNFGNLGS